MARKTMPLAEYEKRYGHRSQVANPPKAPAKRGGANLAALARARAGWSRPAKPAAAAAPKAAPKPAHVGAGTHLGALPLADNPRNITWKGSSTTDGKFSVAKQAGSWHALDHRTRKSGIQITGRGYKTKTEAVGHVEGLYTDRAKTGAKSDAALMQQAREKADASQAAARRAAENDAGARIGGQPAGRERIAAIGARAAFRAADKQIAETSAALASLPAGHRLTSHLEAHREHLTVQREGHRAEAGHHDLKADFDSYGRPRAGHTAASRALMAAERAAVPAIPPGS